MTTSLGGSYLPILPAFPREAYFWLADRLGGKLPTTTRTGHFAAWSFACKRWEEPVRLMKCSSKVRSGARAEIFPCPTAWDHTAVGIFCQPWGCWLHNSTYLSERGPLSHSSSAQRQHCWASLSSNIPQPKWQWESEEVPMAIGQGCRKEQPAKPPWWGKWCLQHSLLSVQSAANGAKALEKSSNIYFQLFPGGCLLAPRRQGWLTVETLLLLWGQSQLSRTLTAI